MYPCLAWVPRAGCPGLGAWAGLPSAAEGGPGPATRGHCGLSAGRVPAAGSKSKAWEWGLGSKSLHLQ